MRLVDELREHDNAVTGHRCRKTGEEKWLTWICCAAHLFLGENGYQVYGFDNVV